MYVDNFQKYMFATSKSNFFWLQSAKIYSEWKFNMPEKTWECTGKTVILAFTGSMSSMISFKLP